MKMKWNEKLVCICGETIVLDFLNKNFENHIKNDETHLKHLKKMWKIKNLKITKTFASTHI
jgi:hypothetical protein